MFNLLMFVLGAVVGSVITNLVYTFENTFEEEKQVNEEVKTKLEDDWGYEQYTFNPDAEVSTIGWAEPEKIVREKAKHNPSKRTLGKKKTKKRVKKVKF